MRRLLLMAAFAGLTLFNAGCLINQYPSDPEQRMNALLNQSEDLRQIGNEWRRFWFNDQPSHLTFDRIDGNVGP
jgi:Mg-chelatase subunit ChlI